MGLYSNSIDFLIKNNDEFLNVSSRILHGHVYLFEFGTET